MSSSKGKPAYVDEVDERTGRVVRENRQVASTKQKPKVHRDSRDSRKSRKSISDPTYPGEGSSRDAPPMDERKEVRIERRKSSGSSKSPRKNRPPSAHENKSFPKASIPSSSRRENLDPSAYGIAATPAAAPPMTQPIPLRPRAISTQSYQRPVSYHAPLPGGGYSRPPLSMSAYYQQPQQQMIAPSYPPASPSYMDNMRYTPAPQVEYFQPQPQARPLQSRFEPRIMDPIVRPPSAFDPISRTGSAFEPISRTASAFGTRSAYEAPGSYFEDNYDYASASEDAATIRRIDRRDSIRIPSNGLTKAQSDYTAMPPPVIRPSILRRSTEYPRAPTEYTLDPDPYRDSRSQYRRESSRPRRSSSTRHSVSYDLPRGDESVRVEAANSGRRRSGYYEPPLPTPTPAYEDKLHKAATYQEDVGGPTVPLTAETLKRQQRRHGGSSRSSQSRDESDYKKSATTRTTRSMTNDNDENVTIKVTGQARVMVGGAQIHCDEGGEIEIKRQKNLQEGSEQSNSEYDGGGRRGGQDRGQGGGGRGRIEDRRSRVERPTLGRSHRSSQSGHSYTRATPHYPGEGNFI
ncbi:hypothetical protein N431DRAFT_494576 [Stipitochalara longipes BDJ]|nr:hypothetical protein N431DRAFT_494576 [Stipitochalara longipes BDJ]